MKSRSMTNSEEGKTGAGAAGVPMNVAELERLSADRPQRTVEEFKPNDFYGNAAVLKRYAGLPADFVIRGLIPHGAKVASKVWDVEVNHAWNQLLLYSEEQRAIYARHTAKPAVVVGAPFLYARRLLESEWAGWRGAARGTVVFPTHSTHHLTAQYDEAEFIRQLRGLPAEQGPVRVCLYWRDVQLGRHRAYLEAGFECVTAGHMYDPEFLFRLVRILGTHRYAAANRMGSSVLYAAASGLPVLLFPQESRYAGPDARMVAEVAPELDLPVSREFYALAGRVPGEIVARQRDLAEASLGVASVRSPEALREVLERLPGVRPAAGVSFAFSGNLGELLSRLGRELPRLPRRTPGTLTLDGRPLAYADLHSLFHQAEQIFARKLYDFVPGHDQPLILDCGAHIGLASLYFASRFPRATIRAYEADPTIAGMLAENVRSFGLGRVTVDARAVWVHGDGVSFAATADDSGHVRAGGGTNVPSVRLRDELRRQPVDLLKLDIEGAEFSVIRDCADALANVRCLLIEAHRFREEDGQLGEMLSVLERSGFDYTLGDLHAADWIRDDAPPPFPAARCRRFIVTVFAWQRAARGLAGEGREAETVTARLVAALGAGRHGEAVLSAEQELAVSPQAHGVRLGLAVALGRMGRREDAVRELDQVLGAWPGHGRAEVLREELAGAALGRP